VILKDSLGRQMKELDMRGIHIHEKRGNNDIHRLTIANLFVRPAVRRQNSS
jgi:hypothetical protein